MEDVFRQLSAGVCPSSNDVSHERGKRKRSVDLKRGIDSIVNRPLVPALDFFSSVKKRHTATEEGSDIDEMKEEMKTKAVDSVKTQKVSKKKGIKTEKGMPARISSFDAWGMSDAFEAVSGSRKLMEVQSQVAPCLAEGYEVIAVAPTGSGKTLAYAVPLVKRATERTMKLSAPGALVLVPTKELAQQIAGVIKHFAYEAKLKSTVKVKTLITKAHISGLAGGGAKSCHILVATPLRLISAIRSKAVDLSQTQDLVLDEADKLFEDGFVDQIDEVLSALGKSRLHLFSATMPPVIEDTARTVMKAPVKIVVGGKRYGGTAAVDSSTVKQRFMFADGQGEAGKVVAFRRLLTEGLMPPTLVFVQSQDRAAELFRELIFDGVNIDAIHAGRTQKQREQAIHNFRSGKVWILIATELLARGIDFRTVNSVVNYDLPATPAAYVHRIGRTGRAGRTGQAITFFTEDDKPLLRRIVNVAVAAGAEVPEWMTKLSKGNRGDLKDAEKRPVKRGHVGETRTDQLDAPIVKKLKRRAEQEAKKSAIAIEAAGVKRKQVGKNLRGVTTVKKQGKTDGS